MSLLHIGGSSGASSVVPAEGVDFDGVSDYLSRSSDLVGNVDSKTFTFSCWVYLGVKNSFNMIYEVKDTVGKAQIWVGSTGFDMAFSNSAGTIIMDITHSGDIPKETWLNILVSVDLANASNRHIYINDTVLSGVAWNSYTNGFIDFTCANHCISAQVGGGSKIKGRLSNLFLSHQYMDLSIEANRRIFINSDGTSTGNLLQRLTSRGFNVPILYLPMRDSATCHVNEGTGGNFTLNGTIATSNRGANQDNCVASYFDGSADYLSRGAALASSAESTVFTLSFNRSIPTNSVYIFNINSSTSYTNFYVEGSTSGIKLYGRDSLGNETLRVTFPNTVVVGKKSTYTLSMDLTDVNKRYLFVDGVDKTSLATWGTYGGGIGIAFNKPIIKIASDFAGSTKSAQNLGELYFDTKYIDLATNNPFWIED